MELRLCRCLNLFSFLYFIERSFVQAQTSQEAQNSNDQGAYFFYQRSEYPRDCKEIQQKCSSAQNPSRAHLIQPDGVLKPFLVYCEGDWTLIQRRENDFVDFNRNWTEYNDGFGFLNSDFWIGNEKLGYLTNQKQYELMITFETATGDSYHVSYNMFRISDAFSEYTLISVGQFTGMLDLLLTMPPADCYDLQQAGSITSGNYIVEPAGWTGGHFIINCNMDIDDGGWTVFQRRVDGTESFNLTWNSYKKGFGTPSGDFWMGNDKLAFLTNQKEYELRIDLTNGDGDSYYAIYDFFRITDERNNYRLIGLGNFNGTADFDAMRYHHYQTFSTGDRDNDPSVDLHCATQDDSAWWYNNCYHCDLNWPSHRGNLGYWYNLPGSDLITYSEMKIRPVERTTTS